MVSPNPSRIALITGTSSGIGRATAGLLVDRGFTVFGASRRPTSVPGVVSLHCDVTSPSSVGAAVETVLANAGRIDLLVNNAGKVLTGALEETSLGDAWNQFETNFFGVVSMTHAVLPTMRRQRAGRIVNVGSVLGFLPAPYLGMYAATKHALRGYTETLDHEVRTLGIRACLVEPHLTRTSLLHEGQTTGCTVPDYAAQRYRVLEGMREDLARAAPPEKVAHAIWRAATRSSPRVHHPVGYGVTLHWLRRLVPSRLFDRTLRDSFRMD